MAIKCKEDLANTYIVNDKGVLRDAYLDACRKLGFKVKGNDWHGCEMVMPDKFERVDTAGLGFYNKTRTQLHLSDLIDLENTKVYTTDPEVIRKYTELCGKKFECEITSSIGVYNCDTYKKINDFMMGSPVDIDSDFKQLTTDQITALYDEEFGKVETPEEAEAFDIMAQDNESVEMQAMIDYENSVQSQIHRVGDMLHNITCSMHDDEDLQQELGLIVSKLWSVKVETPQQREERERLEAAYDLYCTVTVSAKGYAWFKSCTPVMDKWLTIVDKTGYRKQKDGE